MPDSIATPQQDTPEPAENEDVEAHGIESEDDTEAAQFNINIGCGG